MKFNKQYLKTVEKEKQRVVDLRISALEKYKREGTRVEYKSKIKQETSSGFEGFWD